MPSAITLRHAVRKDWDEIAELIFLSTNHWYQAQGKGRIFNCRPHEARLFCEVYDALEPGCCIVAENNGGKIVGSCFYHPRETHVSLGIMNVHPNYVSHRIASRLLRFIVDFAKEQAKPLRLVSSAMNLDSFSLYNRVGMVPYAVFQDMILAVPKDGLQLTSDVPGLDRVRDATLKDVPVMVELEQSVHGIRRDIDFKYFIKNETGIWHVSVIEDRQGWLTGFLVSVNHPASRMLGPGVMRTDEDAVALIVHELNHHAGQTMVWLVPSNRPAIIEKMYALGAKNCEIHFGQILGPPPEIKGVVMPTFMPESA